MAQVPQILFDLQSNSNNYRNIVTSIRNPNIGTATENVYYKVTSPSGIVIKDIDYNTPDGVLSQSSTSVNLPLVALPLVTGGDVEEGRYEFLFQIEDAGRPGLYTNIEARANVDFKTQGADTCVRRGLIEFAVDCFCLNLTVTDNTNYSDVTLISRELVVVPPTIPNEPAPTNQTTTNQSIDLTFGYSGVNYDANLFSVFEHTVDDEVGNVPSILIRESISSTERQKIICDHNLCKLMDCIEAFYRTTATLASEYGGIQKLPFDQLDKWLQIDNLLTRYNIALACQNTTLLEAYYAMLQEITGCDCGCSDPSSSDIVRLTPVCGGGTGSGVTSVIGIAPVMVTTTNNVASVSLSTSFINLVSNGVSELEVNTTDNSGTYLSAARDSTVSTKWILSFDDSALKYDDYTVATDAGVNAALFGVKVSDTPYPLRYAKNNFLNTLKIDGTFRVENRTTGLPICLFDANAPTPITITTPANARSGPTIPCFNETGDCVGSIALGNLGTTRNLLFTANNNYAVGAIVYTCGTLNID